MNFIYSTVIVISRGLSPEPLPLLLLASVFLASSWAMRRVGAKSQH